MTTVDPRATEAQCLLDALTAAGFPAAGRGRHYVRFGWPGQDWPHGSLLVPTDPDAPEFDELLTAVRAQLGGAARKYAAAVAVLNPNPTNDPQREGVTR